VQTVTLGATRLAVTPIAHGTWQFGDDRGPVDQSAGAADLRLSQDDVAEIDQMTATAVPVGGPSPEGVT
jgi:hypothetical protein